MRFAVFFLISLLFSSLTISPMKILEYSLSQNDIEDSITNNTLSTLTVKIYFGYQAKVKSLGSMKRKIRLLKSSKPITLELKQGDSMSFNKSLLENKIKTLEYNSLFFIHEISVRPKYSKKKKKTLHRIHTKAKTKAKSNFIIDMVDESSNLRIRVQ